MDYFYGVFTAFLGLESGSCVDCQWSDRKLSDFIKNIFICVLKINESLTGLGRHEGRPGVAIGRIPGGPLINWAVPLRHKGSFTQDTESASQFIFNVRQTAANGSGDSSVQEVLVNVKLCRLRVHSSS